MDDRIFTLAIAQMGMTPGDREANLVAMDARVARAAGEGAVAVDARVVRRAKAADA